VTEPATNPMQPGLARKAEDKKKEKKARQIEVTLPLSVNRELDAFVGDNPVRKKLRPLLEDAIRTAGAKAAAEAIVGKLPELYAAITK